MKRAPRGARASIEASKLLIHAFLHGDSHGDGRADHRVVAHSRIARHISTKHLEKALFGLKIVSLTLFFETFRACDNQVYFLFSQFWVTKWRQRAGVSQ